MTPPPTPSQTVGPFFAFGLGREPAEQLVHPETPGSIRIRGTVIDGAGEPVPDAMVEIWQADRDGRYPARGRDGERSPAATGFVGFGRSLTDERGQFGFVTVKPGPVAGPGGRQAPHIAAMVYARGLLRQLPTRIYFPDEQGANAEDPVLSAIEDPELRASLVARREDGSLRFDVHLQGERETAFFQL